MLAEDSAEAEGVVPTDDGAEVSQVGLVGYSHLVNNLIIPNILWTFYFLVSGFIYSSSKHICDFNIGIYFLMYVL